MKIRTLEVRNWACIESLILDELHDGIIVLHGPNRTGKSSLVQAIRSCLFDHDHDSQKSVILDASPHKTKAAPHVEIEFEHAGEHYRVSKTFAKTKEGQATLERHGPSGWSVLVRGKDASKRVRDLIGVESSRAGIFQMLWLGQRDFLLPVPREIDPTLAKALESVLGTLITGHDIDFKERLDKACERWFTVKTMKDQKHSPVTRVTSDLDEARARKADIDRQWADAESALKEYDDALARQPELRRNREEAEAEQERVQKECAAVRQHKSQYELTVENLQQSEQLFKQAEQKLSEFDDTARQLESAMQEANNLHLEQCSAQEKRAQALQSAGGTRESAEVVQQQLAQHQQGRAALEYRQRLIANRLEQEAIEGKIHQAEELDDRREELEQKLVGPPVLTDGQINDLRLKRDKASEHRARLAASEIHVSIHAKKPLEVEIASDGEPAGSAVIPVSQERRLLIRQRAEIQIGDLAVIRVGRGKEDRDLEALANELAEIERSLRDTLTGAQLDPNDPTAIDQLASRRLQQEESTRQLKSVRAQIGKAAPSGIPSLHAQLKQKRAEQQTILTRRPELHSWIPDQAEMDRLRFEFDDREGKLKSDAQEAKQMSDRLNESLRQATDAEQTIRTRIAGQLIRVQNLKEIMGRLDRAALAHERDVARARSAEAKRKVEETTLSEAEQAIETQYQNIRTAHAHRAERLRSNEILLAELRVKLAGTEGLHQKRIQAEQAVNDKARELERESLHAQAHKHLKELFEEVRQEQVRRTVGPINDRVMGWAKQLGLTDYSGLSFGNELLPEGLVSDHAADGEPVALDRESYGTLEQLSLLIRLAVGGLLSQDEPAVAILDDPLAHADLGKHRKMLDILARASRGEPHGPHPTGPLQLIILTCHEDRFDYLDGAQQFDLARLIHRGS
jgi:DNA repair exonuclease SbcCD ATPase subunit